MRKLLFALVMVLSSFNAMGEVVTQDKIVYVLSDDLTATVKGINEAVTQLDIPPYITVNGETYTVTAIGKEAFKDKRQITSATLPASLHTIGDNAFKNCTKLESIRIPDNVTTLGESAFHSCSALTQVYMPEGLETIGSSAFYGTKIRVITIPKNVSQIEKWAFQACNNLQQIWIMQTTPPILC